MTNKKQLTLFVDFHVHLDRIEEWKAAHRPDPEDPSHFRLVEIWDADREWFETKQLTKPYYATLWEKSRPTWQKEVVINYFERLGEGCRFRKGFLEGGELMD
ncbi:hypothetical protein LTS17_010126 [Exophiala oligosperma]